MSSSTTTEKSALPPTSRLSRMKAQFQQKQMQEKEHKLLQMLDNQQQLGMQKAGLNGVLPSKYSNNSYNNSANGTSTPGSFQPGKVRQMFEERRKGGPLPSNHLYSGPNNGNNNPSPGYRSGGIIGIDKSYPLDPIVAPPGKSRTSSSKSDPAPVTTSTYARNTRNSVNQKVNPVVPPASKRGISLDRTTPGGGRSRDGRDSSFSTNGLAPIGSYRRANSGLSGSSYDEDLLNSNTRVGINNNGEKTTTTKYSEIYKNAPPLKSPSPDALSQRESRETTLGNKIKGLKIRDDDDDSQSSRAPGRPSSPPKRPVPPPRSKPKAPTPPARAAAVLAPKKTASTVKPPPHRGPPPPGLEECKVCGRYFASDRIAKHETICKKTTTKKRKIFDPTKMRMQGTEAEPYIRKVSAKAPVQKKQVSAGKKGDWRRKHEEFIKTIRAAKEYQAHVAAGGNPADLPPPPPADTSDYVQCPYCGRKFSGGAAERHIPKCKNIKSNKR